MAELVTAPAALIGAVMSDEAQEVKPNTETRLNRRSFFIGIAC